MLKNSQVGASTIVPVHYLFRIRRLHKSDELCAVCRPSRQLRVSHQPQVGQAHLLHQVQTQNMACQLSVCKAFWTLLLIMWACRSQDRGGLQCAAATTITAPDAVVGRCCLSSYIPAEVCVPIDADVCAWSHGAHVVVGAHFTATHMCHGKAGQKSSNPGQHH